MRARLGLFVFVLITVFVGGTWMRQARAQYVGMGVGFTPTYSSPPQPSDRFRIGTQYFDREDLQLYLLGFPYSRPFIDEMKRKRRKGIGLVVGGVIIMVAGVGVSVGLMVPLMRRNVELAMGVTMGCMFGSLAIGMGLTIPGLIIIKKSKSLLRRAINAYNVENQDEPIVIEQFSMRLHPYLARGGGGLALSLSF